MSNLSFSILGRTVRVRCEDPELQALLTANYGTLLIQETRADQSANLEYRVDREKGSDSFYIQSNLQEPVQAHDPGEFLFLFEKELVVALQKLRPEFYFIHGAALEFAGRSLLLVAESGGGKSTTTWALLHHGFRYISDELAPVDPANMAVYGYLHALCLKVDPPHPYSLPSSTIRTACTLHVPISDLPSEIGMYPCPLEAIFFLNYRPETIQPSMRQISIAEAGAKLYANALNPLAHPSDGLETAIRIVKACRCFELQTADLYATSMLMRNLMLDSATPLLLS